MKRALLTGATGFIGRNIIKILEKDFCLFTPKRSKLNLQNYDAVRAYIQEKRIDIVFHCANPNPVKNKLDSADRMIEDSIRIFMNLYNCRDLYEKMIYTGSGAEYDKSLEISEVSEEECFRSVPKDPYGFSKYVINQICCKTKNIHNLCVFGCYGPGDHASKFITHCINCCINNQPVTIRQDCRFDYIHVYDLGKIMALMGKNDFSEFMYNITDKHLYLSEIAEKVKSQMNSRQPVIILDKKLNNEYTASNKRLLNEIGNYEFIDIDEGIRIQIESELQKGQGNET